MRTKTALVIVDMQTGLVTGREPVYQLDTLLEHAITQARTTGTPIIYIQDNDVDEIGSPGWQIHSAILPNQQDLALRKSETDAFYEMSLLQELEACDIGHLFIVGCKSEACVDATCHRDVQLGYEMTLVGNVHSTTDTPVLPAPQIIAYHNYLLPRICSDEHGKVVGVTVKPTREVVMGSF